ncbi:ferredoxin:thioredoxin reductase [Desulfovibrio sp. OttesenSCG-928-F07]|nr:ferredoxin:thioredoxin reductase [Desulfovibrio sp. OttesenSCG-928-F07]
MTAEKLFEQLRKVNEPKGFFFNPDTQITMDILNSLLEIKNNYGYVACPCRLSSGNREKDSDIQCPCAYRDADVKEHGSCYCGLYVSEDVYTGKKERKVVPERRPVERILA